jgi:hypothetical protein
LLGDTAVRTVKQLHELKALTAEKLALEAQIEGEPTPTADLGRLFARHHHVCLRIRELRDKLDCFVLEDEPAPIVAFVGHPRTKL